VRRVEEGFLDKFSLKEDTLSKDFWRKSSSKVEWRRGIIAEQKKGKKGNQVSEPLG